MCVTMCLYSLVTAYVCVWLRVLKITSLLKKKSCELLLINKSLFSSFSKFSSTKRIQGLVTDLNLFSDPSHRPSRSEKFP